MNRRTLGVALACLLAASVTLAGCTGDGVEGIFTGFEETAKLPVVATFWATNLATDAYYQVTATKVGEGTRCYVYLEQGRSVSQATIDAFIAQFDNTIYPRATGAFGGEPNPGIDGDPKIYLLLLDIRDTFNAQTNPVFIGGYFAPVNQFRQADLDQLPGQGVFRSNEKEMFYMDIDPGAPGTANFHRTLAHEFQHMIHFEQKFVNNDTLDDTWLNEAMSEASPLYCGYGPDYGRVDTYETDPGNSLTVWDGQIEDYGVVYMWAQYLKDRVDPSSGDTVFRRMLLNPESGIDSVNAALLQIGYGKDFNGVFRDWAVANYSGTALSWPGHPEWSYRSVDTWPGTHPLPSGGSTLLPGLFVDPARTNQGTLPAMGPYSVNYFLYTPSSGAGGTVTWTAPAPSAWAALGDNVALAYGLVSGVPSPYTGAGYLIAGNPTVDNASSGGGVAYASVDAPARSAREMLRAAGRSRSVERIVAATGEPFPVCVQPFLAEGARALRERGLRPAR